MDDCKDIDEVPLPPPPRKLKRSGPDHQHDLPGGAAELAQRRRRLMFACICILGR